MAQAKQKLKVIYHTFFCDDNLGEADGFFEINDGKLEYVTGWFCNDAHWRGEYMSDLLEHAGAEIKDLPDKHQAQASRLMAKAYGLDGEEEESEHEREEVDLEYRRGTSDKAYHLSIFENADGWVVEAVFGRRGGNPQHQVKCEGEDYETAKKLYNKVLNEKLKKGYEEA
jgi:predicted DNA-binding WGR domain protein